MTVKSKPFINSFSSTGSDKSGSKEEKRIREFAKCMLLNRIFVGDFREKHYVPDLNTYRDVIALSNTETELQADLGVVKKRLSQHYEKCWIGITEEPGKRLLWVQSSAEVFGTYTFKITRINFNTDEVSLRIKPVRRLSRMATPVKQKSDESSPDPLKVSLQLQKKLGDLVSKLFTTILTFDNVKNTSKFIFLLALAIVTGAIDAVPALANFILRFMHECSVFMHTSTPFLLGCLNLISKVVGGFYLLVFGMWKSAVGPQHPPPPVYRNTPRIGYR